MGNVFIKNTATKWQSNLVDLDSAFMLLSSQTLDQAKNWFIFFDNGNEEWIHILDSAEVLRHFKSVSVAAAAPVVSEEIDIPKEFFNPDTVEEVSIDEVTEPSFETEVLVATPELAAEPIKPGVTKKPVQQPAPAAIAKKPAQPKAEAKESDRRMYARFDIRLRVIIKSGKSTYLTYTRDVSLGGLSLMNDVPEAIFNSEAEIYITAPDQRNNIMFKCLPVASKFGKSRLMFTKVDDSKQKIMATWLHHFVKPSANKVS